MRHASAASGMPDQERPLNFEGRKQLEDLTTNQALGLFDRVTHVLCSSAIRTRQTCASIAEIIPGHARYEFLDNLYNAPAEAILEELNLILETAEDILIIGHNPGVSEFLSLAVNTTGESSMRTAQIACYDISASSQLVLTFSDCQFRQLI